MCCSNVEALAAQGASEPLRWERPGGRANSEAGSEANDCSPEIGVRTEVAVRGFAVCRPVSNVGKADASGEETSECTLRAAGVGVQASEEGFAETKSGRSRSQQGLTATCKDRPHKASKLRRQERLGLAHECVVARTGG